jgi:outer membrane protein OmpA-like peptidoglycan-associated protein
MKRKSVLSLIGVIALLTAATGCGLLSPPTQREEMAAYGGLAGGATGAVIGSFVGSAVAGGLFGIPLGAVAGYYLGDRWRESPTREAKADSRDTELARLRAENERLREQARQGAGEASEKDASAVASTKPSTPAPVRQAAPATPDVAVRTVLFDFNRSTMNAEAKQSLVPVVKVLNGTPGHKVRIEGYTDSVGSDAYNQALSQKRSESVKNFLVQSGLSANQIAARGFGEANPVASNDTEEGRRLNRRVEIIILDEKGTAAAAARDR